MCLLPLCKESQHFMDHSRCCHNLTYISQTHLSAPVLVSAPVLRWWCRNSPETLWSVIILRCVFCLIFQPFPLVLSFYLPLASEDTLCWLAHLPLIISPFSLPQINHFSQILVSGSSPGRKQTKPGCHAGSMERCGSKSGLHYSEGTTGTTNSPLFIPEDAETEEARTAWLVGGICSMASRIYSAWQLGFTAQARVSHRHYWHFGSDSPLYNV